MGCTMLGMLENEGMIGNAWKTSLNKWQVRLIENAVGNCFLRPKDESVLPPPAVVTRNDTLNFP